MSPVRAGHGDLSGLDVAVKNGGVGLGPAHGLEIAHTGGHARDRVQIVHRPGAHKEDQSPIQTGQSLEVPVRQVPVPRMGGDDDLKTNLSIT